MAHSMKDLASALAQSIKQIEADYGEEAREVRAKLAEALAEAEKHEPSSTKLKAILTDVREAVKSVAALDPVWRTVQRVARLVGLD
jgi:ubiquinone biosynthesis protein UbiJ